MVLWRRREAWTLQKRRVANIFGFRHVDEEIHARAVLVRIVMTGARLDRGRAAVMTCPVQIIEMSIGPAAPARFEITTGSLQHFICVIPISFKCSSYHHKRLSIY